MNANKMLCKSRFFISYANAFHNDADAKCPYDAHVSFQRCNFHDAESHAGVQMQSLSMMVSTHIFNRDANVFLQRWRCKNLVVQMPSNGYVMMQMLLVGMS